MKVESITTDAAEAVTTAESLDAFLLDVQARALAMARLATGSADEALDLVQDAMCSFVRRYRNKPVDQRRPLFFRCLSNRIVDWHRQRQRRGRWMFFGPRTADETGDGPDSAQPAPRADQPDAWLGADDFGCALESALKALPPRQRQVFLLRAWEGMDVRQTAAALGIGAGSVKTHYFRALAALRTALEKFHE